MSRYCKLQGQHLDRKHFGKPPPPDYTIRWILVLSLLVLAYRVADWTCHRNGIENQAAFLARNGVEKAYQTAWSQLAESLNQARPIVRDVKKKYHPPAVSIEWMQTFNNDEIIDILPHDIKLLQRSHHQFVDNVRDSKMSAVYNETSQGIVVTANGQSLPAVIVQLRLLRKTSSTLPVEVFLLSEADYDDYVCNDIFPALNAQCKVLQAFMAAHALPRLPEQRQTRTIRANEAIHKYLAVFFSSFEDNLVLDPATLVLHKPDTLFSEELYSSNKLILWPDFWLASVSPSMYEIQQEDTPPPSHRTVDLGQFVISKSTHFSTLLLSIYYTYFGGMLYDDLLKQSNGGEAGSQAIRAASFFVEEHGLLIDQRVSAVGYIDQEAGNAFHGVGMLQSFPFKESESTTPLFIRSTNPLISPATIMQQNATHFNTDTVPHALWGGPNGLQLANQWGTKEAEIALWREIAQVACKDSIHMTKAWPTNDGPVQCTKVTKYMESMSFLSM